ncbi:MAG: 4-hydroxy-tetrahydrodipicolinate synthase [Candidatus Pacebacteria bacterium]|nr:4-hydroxy-tetrahydrodipicolinate synthase [Candidatus Paceibacterota bacterium]
MARLENACRGAVVALVTPFRRDDVTRVDEVALQFLIEFHIMHGTDAIVMCGTTGESPTLSHEENIDAVRLAVQFARDRIKIIAGTGSNCTAEAIRMTKLASQVGADASLQVCPYYNRPTQEGLFHHYRAIVEAVPEMGHVIYSIKARTGVNMEPALIERLAKLDGIVGIKEASGDLNQMKRIIELTEGKLDLLSGDDGLTLDVLKMGGVGVVSVLGNIMPRAVKEMVTLFKLGDIAGAEEIHARTLPLVKTLFIESNPTPVKTAMGLMGMCSPSVRQPLWRMSETNQEKLEAEMRKLDLIK